jgi:putative ATPase
VVDHAVARGSAGRISRADLAESLERKVIPYDRAGGAHYDVTSALIKSVRGSDPDAALYWLARMLEGGEDPLFIARRVAILASEDIGNAAPQALNLAAAALTVTQAVGLPECQYALAQAVVYLACAPKSNAVARAIAAAREDVRNKQTLDVPAHLRNHPPRSQTRAYVSPHTAPDGIVAQDYLAADPCYYEPSSHGFEATLAQRIESIRRALRQQPHNDAQSP